MTLLESILSLTLVAAVGATTLEIAEEVELKVEDYQEIQDKVAERYKTGCK